MLSSLAEILARHGQADQATRLADQAETADRTITDPADRAWVLSALAGTLARRGQSDRATRLAHEAERVARTITDPTPMPRTT
ncbi:hypothetical protein GCM10010106_22920 [Thermopolyspora flexuosa]|uniref:hypothetical protein n=1 Tax=Thermopolyspora flexuosa TaxID=103836 RepID=UPI00114FD118|nr:hypothetical protein [Thermopolyspora flexuosa]GGM75828.1 hypothetical protein GCM10010106_22920 [Thermopolyspora flexuosa]